MKKRLFWQFVALSLIPLLLLAVLPVQKMRRERLTVALVRAVERGEIYIDPTTPATVRQLLTAGADANALASDGRPLLAHAIAARDWKLFSLLREHNAHLSPQLERSLAQAKRLQANLWLLSAAGEGNAAQIQLALNAGADPNAGANPDAASTHMSPLHLAIESGDEASVSLLLTRGADAGEHTAEGLSLLSFALREGGYPEILQALLKSGASSDPVSRFMVAAALNQRAEVETYLASGADVDALNANGDGWTALMWAAAEGHPRLTQLLLEHGANPFHRDSQGRTPVALAQHFKRSSTRLGGYNATIVHLERALASGSSTKTGALRDDAPLTNPLS